jgi:hypothetical protein
MEFGYRNLLWSTGTPVLVPSLTNERTSVSDPDPHSSSAWIQVRIPNADPDSGGLKRARMQEITQPKDL